jgi:hypothetical protein
MSAVSGLLTTLNAQNTDLVGEWQEEILVRNSKGYNVGSTLFGLMAQLQNEPADNITFNWWERDPVRLNFYSIASAYAATTTLAWDDGTGASPGLGDLTVYQLLSINTILMNSRTLELVQVAADPTTQNVSVVRGALGTTAAAVNPGDLWTLITSAQDEGANPRRAAYENPTSYDNYIQTYNESLFLSNAFKNGVLRTDVMGPLPERRLQALERITKRIELSYFLGVKGTATGTNGTIYFTGGLKNAIDSFGLTANALNGLSGTGIALSVFYTWLQAFMVVGSDTKLMFCGPLAYAAITQFALSASGAGFRIMNQETVFGMNITVILTPFGEISLAFHPLFKDAIALNSWAFVVDLQLVKQKVMEPLFLEPNIQLPGQDSYMEQFRAKLGLKQKFPAAFGYAYNLQKIIAG